MAAEAARSTGARPTVMGVNGVGTSIGGGGGGGGGGAGGGAGGGGSGSAPVSIPPRAGGIHVPVLPVGGTASVVFADDCRRSSILRSLSGGAAEMDSPCCASAVTGATSPATTA